MGIFSGKAKPANYRTPRAITSAATPVRLRDRSELEKLRHQGAVSRAWQLENWRVYDNLGEVNYAFNLVASALSRVRIHAAVVLNPDEPPTEVTDSIAVETLDGKEIGAPGGVAPEIAVKAREYIAQLGQGDGIPSLLRAYGLNKNTAGECYLCLLDDEWSIRSTFELMVDPGGSMRLQPSASTTTAAPREIPKDGSTVIRMWTKHPQYSSDPDCSLRAVLFLCEQLIKLNRMINNAIQSRMNAGILQVASEILAAAATPGAEGNVDNPDDVETEGFQADLNAAMTQPIIDDQSGAAVIPLVVNTPHEYMDGIKWITLARDVDEHMLAYAENLLTRILNGIPIPKDSIVGFQNVRYCVDDETEALTRNGWVRRADLRVGDSVLVLDHDTGLSRWEPVLAVNQFDVVDEPVLSIEGEGHSSLTTDGHRWPIVKAGKKVSGSRRRWTTSADGFSATDRVPTAAEASDTPTEAKYSDDFVRLIALYTSDGCRVDAPRGRPWVSIGKQADHPGVNTIRGILTRLYGPAARGQGINRAAWNEYYDESQNRLMFRLNVDASEDVFAITDDPTKVVPLDFVHALTRAQLDLFLEAFVDLGDGHLRSGSTIQTYQSEPGRLDALALAGVLAGRMVRWSDVAPGRPTPSGGMSSDSVRLLISKHRLTVSPGRIDREWTTYTGTVWCPTTAAGTWFARRNGKVFFTGNSNAQSIQEEFYKQSVEPLALAFCDDLTSAYLQPLLQAKAAAEGWPLDDVKKLVVWYDPSEITTRPDRGADADAGWDRGALSDDAWRKAHGFSAEDAPSVEEKLMREIIRNPQLPPNLIDFLARELLPQYFKGAPPLITKAQAGMDEAATTPLQKAKQPPDTQLRGTPRPADRMNGKPPAGSDDQTPPPGGTLPPRTQQ